MKYITDKALKKVLAKHYKWLMGEGGCMADLREANLIRANLIRADLREANLIRADLIRADLREADLREANLSGANLSGANLSGANLSGADLSGADLRRADLRRADLSGADLRRADLRRADLRRADLSGAYLSGANLSGAYLSGANLSGATLPHHKLYPESGMVIVYKKLSNGVIATLEIDAKDIVSGGLLSRKCRARKAKVIALSSGKKASSIHDEKFIYAVGKYVTEPNTSDDIRLECAPGIHFYITKAEAEEHL